MRLHTALTDALAAQGLVPGTWAVFWGTIEGRYFMVGGERLEEYSGSLVTRDGRHFDFWLTGRDGVPMFNFWRAITVPTELTTDREYNQARVAVGLPVLQMARRAAVVREA